MTLHQILSARLATYRGPTSNLVLTAQRLPLVDALLEVIPQQHMYPQVDLSKATITAEIKPEDESPEGHFAYDDPNAERDLIQWIYDQLRSGNQAAWCGYVVTAELGGFKGVASLWACSYESREALEADLREGLVAEALDDLDKTIAHVRAQLEQIGAL